MVERQSIRQMPLKSLEELNKSIRELGLSLSPFNEDVRHLWQLGILRADVVVTRDSLDTEGLVFIGSEGDENRYADIRDCVSKTNGLADVLKDLGVVPANIYPLFHPFRYYVVYRIEQELIPRINAFQILNSTTLCGRALDQFIEAFEK
jgi:hypothetical protein